MQRMRLFHEIPPDRPAMPLLARIDAPNDLRQLNREQLQTVADELREYLLYSVGISGGHFGAGLGVVELTVALHYCLDTPFDQLVWDVGHQAYPHKILTGRRDRLPTIRKEAGLQPSRIAMRAPMTPSESVTQVRPSVRRLVWPWMHG